MNRWTASVRLLIVNLARVLLCKRVDLAHVMAFLECNSPRKMANVLRAVWEKKTKRTVLKSKPYILAVEVNNICNLRCPFCETGRRETFGRTVRNMVPDEIKEIFEALGPYAYAVYLYSAGEPLLNKNLYDFIRLARANRIFTVVSSNMNFTDAEAAEKIVSSGLNYFIAAIDGLTPETYVQYRRGGNYDKAITCLKNVIAERAKARTRWPFIEWQFVVFKHNQHEVEEARKFALALGVDHFKAIPGYVDDPEWLPTIPKWKTAVGNPEAVRNCERPWMQFNVRVDGGVAPCCFAFRPEDDFGNVTQKSFTDIWNNETFVASRQIITRGAKQGPKTPRICHECVATGLRPGFVEGFEKFRVIQPGDDLEFIEQKAKAAK